MKKHILLILIGYVFFVVLFTFPSILHLSDKIIGDGGDNYQFLAFQDLAIREFRAGEFPFGWTNYWRYPLGYEFGSAYDSTLLLISGIVFYQLTTNATLVYNLSVLLFLFLNAFLSYFFFKKATGNTMAGFIGGLIYGFSFYNLARMGGHPNLILSGCFPFFLYGVWETIDHSLSKRSLVIFSLGSILIFLVSLQYALILFASAIFVIPLFFLFYKKKFIEIINLILSKKKEVSITFLSILFVFMWLNGSKVALTLNGTFAVPYQDTVAVPALNYILPNSFSKLLIGTDLNQTGSWIEYVMFLGYFEIALFILYFLSKKESLKNKIFVGSLFTIFFVISLGRGNPQTPLLPFTWLFPIMPFRGITEPGRFYVILYILVAYGASCFIANYTRLLGKIGMAILFVGLTLERLPFNFYLSDTHADEAFIQVVKTTPAKGVLDLPIFWDWWNGNLYDLYAVYYDKPIVNGYIHWSANNKDSNFFLDKVRRFECSKLFLVPDDPALENQNLLKDLKGYGITTIVYHKDLADVPECAKVNEQIRIFLEESGIPLQTIYNDDNKTVYIIPGSI